MSKAVEQSCIPLPVKKAVLGALSRGIWQASKCLRGVAKAAQPLRGGLKFTAGVGKTVLVTTGRQTKTLHVVQALHECGARVVVTDYQEMSMSAASVACDAFHELLPLDAQRLDDWIEHLAGLIEKEQVDLVLPMCTINEALFIGAAKDRLAGRFPRLQWMSEGLALVMHLDEKMRFDAMCRACGVPVPESGRVTSVEDLHAGAKSSVPLGEFPVVLKRLESSTNRAEEVLFVRPGEGVPAGCRPTEKDPWQWQRCIDGREYSAWYVCVNGRVTFAAQYPSKDDLLYFDGEPVPEDVNACLESFIAQSRLTGQYAFDYFREAATGRFLVIECNPRGSSVLEGVSGTPGWGEAFFGVDVRARTRYQKVGFLFHQNSWPWAPDRVEGNFKRWDPAPLLVGEGAWPLELLRTKGLQNGYHHIDTNIGKIIVPGPSVGRGYEVFERLLANTEEAAALAGRPGLAKAPPEGPGREAVAGGLKQPPLGGAMPQEIPEAAMGA